MTSREIAEKIINERLSIEVATRLIEEFAREYEVVMVAESEEHGDFNYSFVM